ncbi:DUF4124 domain-containing protein [Massilia putida]|uniref:DUF4124 domain-containing protein n=1 Tax=Massilia putida TaxID=1141883 RepID=UPI0009510BEA|nr:DUF4124 domain-containing protein [Massilia putida]
MNLNRFLPLLLAALAAHAPAHAQYSWIDDHGTRVFSDRPPPPGTPPSRILKAPRTSAAAAPYAPDTPAAPEPAKPAPPSLAERDAEFRKRAAQRDADERQAAEEARRKADMAGQCAAARRTEAYLNSGRRLTDLDDRGERVVVTDEEKARRLEQARRVLADCR